jgi:hypothetical protein
MLKVTHSHPGRPLRGKDVERLLHRLSFLYKYILGVIPVQAETFQGENQL